ncbi:hypothetical protein UXQ08_12295 [Enterobacter ludwigii]|uniref:hypothetical protein n=1 Tax=Enterobacter ludwigii TaxID=299767 RepID=UPI002FD0CCDA
MSTITKERAAGIANGEKCYTHDDVVELARIALASLEAEAVGTFRKGPCGYSPSFHEDAVPLYTAPPAPVSVPEEMAATFIAAIEKEQDRLFGQDYLMDSKDCIDVIREEITRIKARRAAMLHGKE